MHRLIVACLACFACLAVATARPLFCASPVATAEEQVRATELAFAKSMADRDFAAFQSFLAEDTIFFSGENGTVLRGKAAVAERWKRWFAAPQAPFSWQPEKVAALASGDLASSSGPVFAPDGGRVGTFNSVWHREADGKWRIVIDIGCPDCSCPSGAAKGSQ